MSTKTKVARETREETPVRTITGSGSGQQVKDVIPEDEESVGKELFEKGMREPTESPMANDQRRK